MPSLPPLKALRVFEAASRHLSFTKAADELCVTQGAVSQQIKVLEAALGVELFVRLNQQLRLTSQGRKYALEVREALRLISDATAGIQPRAEKNAVTISCLPSFAHKWLGSRLGKFSQSCPEISLRVHTSFDVVDLARDGIDCAIRHGNGGYDGCFSEILLTEELTPMCSRTLSTQLKTPADLSSTTLLQDYGTEWSEWIDEAGIDPETLDWGAEFMDTSLAIQAAIDGQGVILGHTVLAHDDLKSGALVAPFDLRTPYDCAHWFVCRDGMENRPEIAAVHDWLKSEAKSFPTTEIRLGRLQSPPTKPFG
jgi:LysR family transcriptional regulator, glycine cleavage system transcriptional activator